MMITMMMVRMIAIFVFQCPSVSNVSVLRVRTRHRACESTAAGSIGTNMPRSIDSWRHNGIGTMGGYGKRPFAIGSYILSPLIFSPVFQTRCIVHGLVAKFVFNSCWAFGSWIASWFNVKCTAPSKGVGHDFARVDTIRIYIYSYI